MTRGWILSGGLVLAALVLAVAAGTQAQPGSEDPPAWFPLDSGVSPDNPEDAWHLRTHLRVERAVDQPAGTPVQVYLDLGEQALAAGWPTRADGKTPGSFTLDPDSVQLVRYDHNWANAELVPVHADAGWYDPDRAGTAAGSGEAGFHPRLSPVVTVEWRLMDEIRRSARDYLLQFDIEENHGVPPVEPPSEAQERLDALYWVGPGTVLHGAHPGTDNDASPTLTILGTEDGTEVEVFTYAGSLERSFPFPGDYDQRGNPAQAPFTVDRDEPVQWSFGAEPTLFRIEATAPVLAFGHGLEDGGSADFVPSTDGGLLGTRFHVPPGAAQVYLIAPPAEEGQEGEPIAFTAPGLSEEAPACGGQVKRPPTVTGSYYCRFAIEEDTIAPVQAEQPVLMQYVPEGHARVQVPAATGSPVGQTFLTATTRQGDVSVQAHRSATTVGFHDPQRDRDGGTLTVPVDEPASQATSSWPHAPNAQGTETVPHRIFDESGEHAVLVRADGAGSAAGDPQQTTPVGGSHGQRLQGRAPLSVQPFYDATDVQISFPNTPGTVLTSTLSNARAWTVDPESHDGVDAGDPVLVEASKPVSVVPIDEELRRYSRFLAAKPAFADAEVLASEYRGYLVDVRPESGRSPVLVEATPGKEVEVPFLVQNLARWDGEPLPDRVELEATVDSEEWEVDTRFADASPTLNDDTARKNSLYATMPADIEAGDRVSVRVQGTSANNERMTSGFDALLLSQTAFGVDLWIGIPEPQEQDTGDDRTEVRLEPGEETTVELAVMNTGTTEDAYNLSVDGASGGWEAAVTHDGDPVHQVGPLEPGEVAGLELEVGALELVEVGARSLIVAADSAGSSERATVRVDARLAGQHALHLDAPSQPPTVAPGEETTIPVTVENVGEGDMTGLTFALEEQLPDGWTARFDADLDLANEPQSLASGRSLEAPVAVRVSENATAHTLGSVLLEARSGQDASASLPLSVRAAHERDVTLEAPDAIAVAPGANASFQVRLDNQGNGEETLELVSLSHPGDWNLTASTPEPLPAFGGSANATLEFAVPEDAPAGPVPIQLQAVGAGGLRINANTTAIVDPVGELAWGNVSQQQARAGASLETAIALRNHGNVPANVSLATSVEVGWGLQARPGSLEIPPGATRAVRIEGSIPASAEGDHEVQITAASKRGATARTQIPVEVLQPTLELTELSVPDPPQREGDVVFVSALLHNPGPVPVVDVEVRLAGDNGTLDTASFASIGPNGTVVAPLKWTHDASVAEPRIAWGLAGEDADFVEVGSEPLPTAGSQTDEGDDLPVPWPGVVPLAAGVAAAAVARRRA